MGRSLLLTGFGLAASGFGAAMLVAGVMPTASAGDTSDAVDIVYAAGPVQSAPEPEVVLSEEQTTKALDLMEQSDWLKDLLKSYEVVRLVPWTAFGSSSVFGAVAQVSTSEPHVLPIGSPGLAPVGEAADEAALASWEARSVARTEPTPPASGFWIHVDLERGYVVGISPDPSQEKM